MVQYMSGDFVIKNPVGLTPTVFCFLFLHHVIMRWAYSHVILAVGLEISWISFQKGLVCSRPSVKITEIVTGLKKSEKII